MCDVCVVHLPIPRKKAASAHKHTVRFQHPNGHIETCGDEETLPLELYSMF